MLIVFTFSGDVFYADRFFLFVDGVVVLACKTFMAVFVMLFAVFYIFGIEYSDGSTATMDFIQRYIFVFYVL